MTPHQDDNPKQEKTPWSVRMAIVSALVIFVLATAVIYYRFVTTPATDCIIVVTGNPSLEGYSVLVERLTQDERQKRTLRDTLNEGNQYAARFFLPSGTYRFEVWDLEPKRLVLESDYVPPGSRLTMDLNRKYPDKNAKPKASTMPLPR